ncbi:MAG: hypothetical protein Q8Q12_12590 [bacterium]|nr:hypothetical protein [bacterium]
MRACLTVCFVVLAAYLAAGIAEEPVNRGTGPIESLESADPAQRFAAKGRILDERRSLVQSLLRVVWSDTDDAREVRAEVLRLNSPKLLAIELLGDLRAKEAISSLLGNLTYRVNTILLGPTQGPRLDRQYPAAASLAKIGNPAVPEVLSFLGRSTDPIERHLCVWILVRIDGRDVARFRVEKAIESSRLSDVKANLQAALEYFDKEHLDRAPRKESEKTEGK